MCKVVQMTNLKALVQDHDRLIEFLLMPLVLPFLPAPATTDNVGDDA
jgi:hypothetical protein